MDDKTGNKKKYLLIAEDDKFYSDLYKTKLVNEEFDLDVVGNGEDVIVLAKKRHPDLMVLDLVMPLKDGLETLKEIREDGDLQEIKVVIVSNLPKESYFEQAKELGAADCYFKPDMSADELLDLIKGYLK